MSDSLTYDTSVQGFPFRSANEEEVELIEQGNIYSDSTLSCASPTSVSLPINTFHVRAECDPTSFGGVSAPCDRIEAYNFGYVADVEEQFLVLNNCDLPTQGYTLATNAVTASNFLVSSLPSSLSGATLPATDGSHTYVEFSTFFPTAASHPSVYLKLPYVGNVAALEDLRDDLLADPELAGLNFCTDAYVEEIDVDTAAG